MGLKTWVKENLSSVLIILGIILGMIFGFILRAIFTISPVALIYIGLPGKILIRAFMMVIVPLIISSLSTSITATKRGENKRLIVFSFLLITLFSSFVSIFGAVMVTIVKPGVRSETTNEMSHSVQNDRDIKQMISSQDEALYDVLMNLVPDNIVGATIMTHYTALVPINSQNLSEGYKKVAEKSFKPNMLGLCAFSLVLGFAVLHLQERAITIRTLLEETNSMIMEILKTLLKIMPIGMFSWMCVEAIKMKSPEQVLTQLAWFGATAIMVYASIWFIFYPTVYFLILHKNPFKMYYNIIPAMLVAFGSSSSAITLPVTMRCMEEKNKLSLPISHFFLPLGMTMHMPGAASYYPMVTVFVAQMHGIPLTIPMIISVCMYSVVQSMAFPATPAQGGTLVFFVAACSIIGIDNPFDILAYIVTIDWFMERVRTATNITGDCVIASIVQKFCHYEEEDIEAKESP